MIFKRQLHTGSACRHNGCYYRHDGCKMYRHSRCAGRVLPPPNVIADARFPLRQMLDRRRSGCKQLKEKQKRSFYCRAPVNRSSPTNPLLIVFNQVGRVKHEPFSWHLTWCGAEAQIKAHESDVNQCKNIAKFTFKCKPVQNFRFPYIVESTASAPSYANSANQFVRVATILFRSSPCASRGVKGPPLPTQFGGAKLYRG